MTDGHMHATKYREPVVRKRNEIHRTGSIEEEKLQGPGRVPPPRLAPDIHRVRLTEIPAHDDEVGTCRRRRILAAAMPGIEVDVGDVAAAARIEVASVIAEIAPPTSPFSHRLTGE